MTGTARILEPTTENLARMAEVIRSGELVAMPTETVYGLAGDAFQAHALTRIFQAKERPTFDPLIIHIPQSNLRGGVLALNGLGLVNTPILSKLAWDRADRLIMAFWPGPLTLVLPRLESVPDLATSGLPTVAVRMLRHPIAQALLEKCGTPLAAPSANRFGRISPTRPEDVLEELGTRIGWILNGGPCEIGLESTVLAIDPSGAPTLLRPGGITRQEIEKVLATSVHQAGRAIQAPGMLESHYAPLKPLTLLPAPLSQLQPAQLPTIASRTTKIGLLVVSGPIEPAINAWARLTGHPPFVAMTLSEPGDLSEMARNLFSTLRALDHSGAEMLFTEPCSFTQGLGHAIADRLRRASS